MARRASSSPTLTYVTGRPVAAASAAATCSNVTAVGPVRV
jgi:hypothetical protein